MRVHRLFEGYALPQAEEVTYRECSNAPTPGRVGGDPNGVNIRVQDQHTISSWSTDLTLLRLCPAQGLLDDWLGATYPLPTECNACMPSLLTGHRSGLGSGAPPDAQGQTTSAPYIVSSSTTSIGAQRAQRASRVTVSGPDEV